MMIAREAVDPYWGGVPLRIVVHALRALGLVTLRRATGRKLRPSWSLGFEVLVEFMRRYLEWLSTLDLDRLRRDAAKLTKPLPPGVDLRVESLNGLPLTWVTPRAALTRKTLLFVHGGGFVFGSATHAKSTIGELAAKSRRRVVAPDYRLAPEHPCPAAAEDVERSYRELLGRGVSAADISLVGESAGAGIVLLTLQQLRDRHVELPASAVLFSPLVNLSADSPSWTRNRGVDYGDPTWIVTWNRMYAGARSLDDALVSPLNGDLSGLPPLLVVAGTAELVVDDARALVAKGHRAGVRAELVLGEDMVHAYYAFGAITPRAEEAVCAMVKFLEASES